MTATQLAARALIRLSPLAEGEDVRAFLQGLVTNDVAGALPVYAGLLTAQGKAMFDFLVWDGGDGSLLIDCEADAADELMKRLTLYRLRRKIEILRDDTLAVHWAPKSAHGVADPRLPALGQRWVAQPNPPGESADQAWLAHRLDLGIAEGRAELGDILWLETNAGELNGVSFSKGCYVGQENTARMNWRSKVNRRLIVVPLEQSDPARCKTSYPELHLAIDHLRIENISKDNAPDWL